MKIDSKYICEIINKKAKEYRKNNQVITSLMFNFSTKLDQQTIQYLEKNG